VWIVNESVNFERNGVLKTFRLSYERIERVGDASIRNKDIEGNA
jgi:hypothetical protein